MILLSRMLLDYSCKTQASHMQVEDVMSRVFGLQLERDRDDAMKQSQYWIALTVYEEQLRDGDAGWLQSQMDIDALSQETVSTNSQPQLSTQVLQSAVANREAERQE
jgi:hypothetical protein